MRATRVAEPAAPSTDVALVGREADPRHRAQSDEPSNATALRVSLGAELGVPASTLSTLDRDTLRRIWTRLDAAANPRPPAEERALDPSCFLS